MSVLRVIVVEDQAPAREHLVDLVSSRPDATVVAVCEDGRAAIRALRNVPADVVLLDVQLPECDGFEVLRAVGDLAPAVIFVTANDQHAVKAFEARALDYLLKPFTAARVASALSRARELVQQRRVQAAAATLAGLVQPAAPQANHGRIAVPHRGRVVFLDPADVVSVTAQRNDVVIRTVDGECRQRVSLGELQRRLGPSFVRTNRSTLINLAQTSPTLITRGGVTRLRLANGGEVRVSRSCRPEVERWLRGASATSGIRDSVPSR